MKFPFWRRSLARTIFLGVAALGVLLWAASSQLGLGLNSLLAQFLVLMAALVLLIGLAAVVGIILGMLRRKR